ncbi:MAG: hypothetical protein JO353_00570 [Phycisphaerae bacterium]|nr:hypothetical protein [Phycisphaerae bacterium]
MTYRGIVKDGVVVLACDEKLPEGTNVTVQVGDEPLSEDEKMVLDRQREALFRLVQFGEKMGQVLPTDASRNVDHYLYGAPKR